MVKPFDEAVFGMKVGEIAGPVETQFGYHVIKLDEIKPSEAPKFDVAQGQARGGGAQDQGRARCLRRTPTSSATWSTISPTSLQPVIDKFKLQKQTSGWVTRQGGEPPLLDNEKFLRAVFSDNVLKRKQNTEAVEILPNMLISARVIEHEPAKQRPLEEVQAQIVTGLTQQKAAELAKQEGEALLEKLRKGEDAGLTWSAPQIGFAREARGAAPGGGPGRVPRRRIEAAGLCWRRKRRAGAIVLYRISKVIDVDSVDAGAAQGSGPAAGSRWPARRR